MICEICLRAVPIYHSPPKKLMIKCRLYIGCVPNHLEECESFCKQHHSHTYVFSCYLFSRDFLAKENTPSFSVHSKVDGEGFQDAVFFQT